MEGVRVGEGVDVAVSVEVEVAEVVAVPTALLLGRELSVALGEAEAEPEAEPVVRALRVEEVEGSCVFVAVLEAEGERLSEGDWLGVPLDAGEADSERDTDGDPVREEVFVKVRVGVRVLVSVVEADAQREKEEEAEVRREKEGAPVTVAVGDTVLVVAVDADFFVDPVALTVPELECVPLVEGVTVSVPEAESVGDKELVIELLSVPVALNVFAAVLDTLGLADELAHTVTVSVTEGVGVVVKLKDTETLTKPVMDWQPLALYVTETDVVFDEVKDPVTDSVGV